MCKCYCVERKPEAQKQKGSSVVCLGEQVAFWVELSGEGHTCGCGGCGERLGKEAGSKGALFVRLRTLDCISWVGRSHLGRSNGVRSRIWELRAVYGRV